MNRQAKSPVYQRIVNAYMTTLACTPGSRISIRGICRAAGASRAAFYQYFENLSDLDERFLGLYFRRMLKTLDPTLHSKDGLQAFYMGLALAMKAHEGFFIVALETERLSHYRSRWRDIVGTWLRDYFREPGLMLEDSELWSLHLDFALGIVFRYLTLAVKGDSGFELPELTHWMIEYQQGGLLRLQSRSQNNDHSDPLLDRALGDRAKKKRPPKEDG